MPNLLLFVLVLALTGGVPLADPPKGSVTVYITSEVLQDGWFAPGAKERADSARDLAGAISYDRGLLVVTKDKERADLEVQITAREEGPTVGAIGAVTPPGLVYAKVRRGRMIWATVHVGELKFGFLGTTDRRSWTAAANDLARDLQRWAKDNYEKIVEQRQRQQP